MKLGKISLAGASVALLATHLAIVSSAAARYLYLRWTGPHVWTRTVVYDPEMLMRGRYVSVQLMVDGCGNTLSTAEQASLGKKANGTASAASPSGPVQFPARLRVVESKLVAIRVPEAANQSDGLMVSAWPGLTCAEMRLEVPVDFYIAEHAANPAEIKSGQELWVEVTVPAKGPPEPIQLALKEGKTWKPLGLN